MAPVSEQDNWKLLYAAFKLSGGRVTMEQLGKVMGLKTATVAYRWSVLMKKLEVDHGQIDGSTAPATSGAGGQKRKRVAIVDGDEEPKKQSKKAEPVDEKDGVVVKEEANAREDD